MNSVKWFNLNYLIQNIKKSKGLLSVTLLSVPLLSILSLVISSKDLDYTNPTFTSLSLIAIIGMYIIPIIVSFTLFGFVFKRNKSDFINSMPLNRSTLFATNTIGGIALLILTILISTCLILITGSIFPNIIISKSQMIDYFFIWTITYTLIFTSSNLAISLSGNIITTIIVTILLLFLIPFTHSAYNSFETNKELTITCQNNECKPENYTCLKDTKCLQNSNKGIYQGSVIYNESPKYNLAYTYPSLIYMNYNNYDITISQLAKSLILSIIYFAIGIYAYRKKQMEIIDTSFKSIHIHNTVKSLTIIPLIMLSSYTYLKGEIPSALLIIIATLIYYLIFDLITRKKITKITTSLIYFTITTIIIGTYYYLFSYHKIMPKENINQTQIKEISIALNNNQSTSNVYFKNQSLKNLIIKNLIDKNNNQENTENLTATLKLTNGKTYTLPIYMNEEDYNQIENILYSNTKFKEAIENINYDKIYAISTNKIVFSPEENKKIINMIKKGLESTNLRDIKNNGFEITLYTYENHNQTTYQINSEINEELTRYITKHQNNQINQNIISKDIELENLNIYPNNYPITSLTDYIINNSKKEIYEYIKNNINRDCDIAEDYIELDINYKDKTYTFYTNNVETFEKIIKEKENALKNTEEYKKIIETK